MGAAYSTHWRDAIFTQKFSQKTGKHETTSGDNLGWGWGWEVRWRAVVHTARTVEFHNKMS